ncbi:MAG: glycosyltransferase [Clostridia bacterium]|nr:glycosyltransferase [Clostridia bacterium]
MKTLSLCLIVKNEEKTLPISLKNAKIYADEIIIVDTGSTDNTKKVAQKFTDKIFDFAWQDDFSKARNYAFDLATGEYLMWLDADDFVPTETANNIANWKNFDDDADVLLCPYITNFDKNLTPLFQFNRERIVKNQKRFRFHDRVHEVIVPSGKIVYKDEIKIYHNKKNHTYTTRNLDIYNKMIANGEKFTPRNQFYYARELFFHQKYEEAIHAFSKFLADGKGWAENNIEACLNMAKCYMAIEEENKALSTLFGSFVYDLPRGEILYEIGNIYLKKQLWESAIYYYKLALSSAPNTKGGGFVNVDACTFLPALQLCFCYNKIGDNLTALHYHQISKNFKPDDEKVKYNDEYFKNL